MIGLSLSFCIKEMVDGKVDPNKVTKIISNTCCRTEQDWQIAFERYRKVLWSKNPDACEALARQWIAEGKVEQPRLALPIGETKHSHCSDPAWVNDESEIKWVQWYD